MTALLSSAGLQIRLARYARWGSDRCPPWSARGWLGHHHCSRGPLPAARMCWLLPCLSQPLCLSSPGRTFLPSRGGGRRLGSSESCKLQQTGTGDAQQMLMRMYICTFIHSHQFHESDVCNVLHKYIHVHTYVCMSCLSQVAIYVCVYVCVYMCVYSCLHFMYRYCMCMQ